MKRKNKRQPPNRYKTTLKMREPVNGLTHLIGALLSIAGLVVMIVTAARFGSAWHVVTFSIFGASMFLLYLASSLYHLLPLSEKGVQVFKMIDHIMIFILIAGTYTPICLVPLRGGWGWSLFGVIWGLAISGILLKIFWLEAPRWLSTGIYLMMGWICLVAIYPIVISLPAGALGWLVLGGLFYSIGAVIYAFKWPNPFPRVMDYHGIWHLLVMGGSFCHFWVVFFYITYLT